MAKKFLSKDGLKVLVPKLQKVFATIETSSTAAQPYEEGEYLLSGGQLAKATAAIAQGDTLDAESNIELTTVGEELYQLNRSSIFFKTFKLPSVGSSQTFETDLDSITYAAVIYCNPGTTSSIASALYIDGTYVQGNNTSRLVVDGSDITITGYVASGLQGFVIAA